MGAAIPAYEGTADIWVDKNKAYNLSTFVTASKEYSYPYPVSKNTAEWEQYQAEELKKAYNFQVDVKDACDTLAEKMNEVLASELGLDKMERHLRCQQVPFLIKCERGSDI